MKKLIASDLLRADGNAIELFPSCLKGCKDGFMSGVSAGDQFIVDLSWEDGQPGNCKLGSKAKGECTLKYDGHITVVRDDRIEAYGQNSVSWSTLAGRNYMIRLCPEL
jgi:hypothetical protein